MDYLWRFWYPLLTRLTRNSSVLFLNYGYADDPAEVQSPAPSLEPMDEPDRACIQLYDHVARKIDLQGLKVLEISCGHGGGASYIARYLGAASVHGVDRNAEAVALCNRRHQVPGLGFSCGDAQSLGLASDSFDVAINVEASHCYPDVPRFLAEVRRVLRPGGHFLYADFRDAGPERTAVQQHLDESGLEIVHYEDIGKGVLRGMEANNDRNQELIRQLIPVFLRRFARRFAGVKGSAIYEGLSCGDTIYFCYVLRKIKTS